MSNFEDFKLDLKKVKANSDKERGISIASEICPTGECLTMQCTGECPSKACSTADEKICRC